MKKYLQLSLLIILAISLFSCAKDHSVAGNRPVSTITLDGALEKMYALQRWDTLKITAPKVQQAHTDKPLTYSWEINYKVVSTDKNLSYVCSKFGDFVGRLAISNEDNTVYVPFSLHVKYSYVDGLYILAKYKEGGVVSYLPEGDATKEVILDIFARNNNNTPLKGEPKALYFSHKPSCYIAMADPAMLYQVDPNLFFTKSKIEAPGVINYITSDVEDNDFSNLKMIIGHRIGQTAQSKLLFTNPDQQALEGRYGQVELAPTLLKWKRPDAYNMGEVLYDNSKGQIILMYKKSWNFQYDALFADAFKGLKYIGMGLVSRGQDLAGIFWDENSHRAYHLWVYPGNYSGRSSVDPELKYRGEMPMTPVVNQETKMAVSSGKDLMYYSSANNIYAYSVLSKGNWPTHPLFTLSEGEQVVDLLVSHDDTKLYVATNSPSSELQGSLYCYDIDQNKLLWSKSHVTGKIVQLAYRYDAAN